jgi:hypothetical protein
LLRWPIVPVPDDDECGAVSGMTGRGNRSTLRKPVTVPLFPPQMQYYLTPVRTRAAGETATNHLSYSMNYSVSFHAICIVIASSQIRFLTIMPEARSALNALNSVHISMSSDLIARVYSYFVIQHVALHVM